MNPPIKKYRKVLETLQTQHGSVWMFAIVRRSPSFYRWDVLLSAPWASKDDMNLFRSLDAMLKRTLTTTEKKSAGTVLIRDVDDPFVSQFLVRINSVRDQAQVHISGSFGGDESLLEAYILAAENPHVNSSRQTG
jgi:hypothetical protein